MLSLLRIPSWAVAPAAGLATVAAVAGTVLWRGPVNIPLPVAVPVTIAGPPAQQQPNSASPVASATPPAATPPAATRQLETAPAEIKKPIAPPAFDIVRVEPGGDTVVAGRGTAGASIALVEGGDTGKVLAEGKVDANGQFVLLPQALTQGDHLLALRMGIKGEKSVGSEQNVAVSLAEKSRGGVMVALAEPGKATVILSDQPAASPPAAKAAAPLVAAPQVAAPLVTAPQIAAPQIAAPATIPAQPAAKPGVPIQSPVPAIAPPAPVVVAAKPLPAARQGDLATNVPPPPIAQQAIAPVAKVPAAAAPVAVDAAPPVVVPPAAKIAAVLPPPPEPLQRNAVKADAATVIAPPVVAIRTAEVEVGGGFFATGRAGIGADVRLYLNGSYVAALKASETGQWSLKIAKGMKPGHYAVRADQIAPGDGTVVARAEVPFDYPIAASTGQKLFVAKKLLASRMARNEPVAPAIVPFAPASGVAAPVPAAVAATPPQTVVAPAPQVAVASPPQAVVAQSREAFVAPIPPADIAPAPPAVVPQPQAVAVPALQAAAGQSLEADVVPAAAAAIASPLPKIRAVASQPAPVPAPNGSDVVIGEIQTATVVRGDSLWRISRKALGQGIRYTQIYEANAKQIRNPRLIYIGQVLVMPGVEKP